MPSQPATLTLASCATSSSEFACQSLCLLGIPDISSLWLVGVQIQAGQPIIVVGPGLAVYVISEDGDPFQISGMYDVLNDSVVIQDITSAYLPILRHMECLHMAAFGALSVQQMRLHIDALKQWESFTMSWALSMELELKDAIAFVCEAWNISWFDPVTSRRVIRAITNAATPPDAYIHTPLDINLERYPNAMFCKW